MCRLTGRLRSMLGAGPYCENVPPALRRQPTGLGARGVRLNGSAHGPSALTPEEARALEDLAIRHHVIRQMVADLARHRGRQP